MRRDIGPPVSSKGTTSAEEPAAAVDRISEFRRLLNRPLAERVREYRYRCAQCVIFGLPVLALQWVGPRLSSGPEEAARWVPMLQAVLAGWICYVGALPMVVEGIIGSGWIVRSNLVVCAATMVAYLYSVGSLVIGLVHGHASYRTLFHVIVIALVVWNALGWWVTLRLQPQGQK